MAIISVAGNAIVTANRAGKIGAIIQESLNGMGARITNVEPVQKTSRQITEHN
ncbi:MAG TPA: hypothetical protein VHQ22_04220 [Terriglobales bacterium]|nr:hypothetical protein [Terriglobales bacterium]